MAGRTRQRFYFGHRPVHPVPRAFKGLSQQLAHYHDGQQLANADFLPAVFEKVLVVGLEPVGDVDVNVQK